MKELVTKLIKMENKLQKKPDLTDHNSLIAQFLWPTRIKFCQ